MLRAFSPATARRSSRIPHTHHTEDGNRRILEHDPNVKIAVLAGPQDRVDPAGLVPAVCLGSGEGFCHFGDCLRVGAETVNECL